MNEENEGILLNQIQVVGSHNSYKEAIDPPLFDMLAQQDSSLAASLEYHHISITDQLEMGLRNLELDVFYDPDGGRYASPHGLQLIRETGEQPMEYDKDGEMKTAGFKVLHIQDIDFRSNCLTLNSCLEEIKTWSDANSNHIPVFITINTKDAIINRPGFTDPLPFDKEALDALDSAIRAVLPAHKLLVPDDVRDNYDTLPAAISEKGWPPLSEALGRLVFILDQGGDIRDAYLEAHPALENRVMFVAADENTPATAFFILNNPIDQAAKIEQLVKAGFIVRTRADAGTIEARNNDINRRIAAFNSGAQIITTDYYLPNPAFQSPYRVQLPNNQVALCHPFLAPADCDAMQFESP